MTNIKAKKVILKNRDGEHLVPITDVDALNYKNITNCLLEVPQRIKYDLTDGVLTIKKGSQVIVPYGTATRNYTVVGNLTIVDGVASGFTEKDYIVTPTIDYSNANSWEIYTQKFSVSSVQNLDTILCNNTATVGTDGIAIFIRANGGTSWSVQSEIGTNIFKRDANTNIQINTEYQFKLEFTGSAYNLYLSTNGGSFVLVDTYTSSTKANININLAIGKGVGQYWKGNPIDLKQFSITVDDKVVYRPYIQKGDRFLNDNFKVADTQFADGKFFVWAELVGDLSKINGWTGEDDRIVIVDIGNNKLEQASNNRHSSGTTAPTATNVQKWYDTNSNLVKMYNQGADTGVTNSLPICAVTPTTDVLTSVTQVFNGMGYIGSTVWVDKGVKGLIPNGRNEDGSLNNIEWSNSSFSVLTHGTSDTSGVIGVYRVDQGNINWFRTHATFLQEEAPAAGTGLQRWYKPSDNIWRERNVSDAWYNIQPVLLGEYTVTSGVISNFNAKETFHAADIQDVVRKTGDTMTGALELEGNASIGLFGGAIYTHTMDMAIDDVPTSANYDAVFQHEDKNRVRKSRLESFWFANGGHGISLSEKKSSSENTYASIRVGFTASGNAFCDFPRCTTKATTTSTANNSCVAVIVENYKSGTTWRRIWSDGWIEQGGKVTVTRSNYKATITFPKAFSDTNYNIMFTAQSSDAAYFQSDNINVSNDSSKITKTSIEIASEAGNTFYWRACGY